MMKARKPQENRRIRFGHFAESNPLGGDPKKQSSPDPNERLFELKAAEEMAKIVSFRIFFIFFLFFLL